MYATLSANPPVGAFSPSVTVSEAFEPSAADAVELSAYVLVGAGVPVPVSQALAPAAFVARTRRR